jgi:ribosomal protein L40E
MGMPGAAASPRHRHAALADSCQQLACPAPCGAVTHAGSSNACPYGMNNARQYTIHRQQMVASRAILRLTCQQIVTAANRNHTICTACTTRHTAHATVCRPHSHCCWEPAEWQCTLVAPQAARPAAAQ